MLDSTSPSAIDSDRLSAVIAEFRRQKAATADQRKEIAVLVKQIAAEGERLAQRNRDISSQMRNLEANLDGFSRAEIKQLCSTSHEAQMRQFMMQSQLEQLRNRQANLERTEELLQSILEVATSLPHSSGERQLASTSEPGTQLRSDRKAATSHAGGALPSIELAFQRLSRELQDGTSHVLSDLILRAEVCERMVEMDRQKAREEIARLRSAATAALRATRQLAHELHPPLLEESGVAAALHRYVEISRSGEKLQIDIQIAGQERRLPNSVELALFRVIQEALNNAARHSGTGRAEVRLRFESGQVVATIADEGRGFEMEPTLAQAAAKGHSGFADMQLRARMVRGTLEISGKPGAGCMVSLAVPA